MIKTHWSQSDPRWNIPEYEKCSFKCFIDQGRIQDFKLGGAHLKKLRRGEGGAKIVGVFRVKNHDFTPKNHIFSNFRGGGRAGCTPLDPPLLMMSGEHRNVISRGLSMMVSDNAGSK